MKEKIKDILEKHYHGRNRIEEECAIELLGLFNEPLLCECSEPNLVPPNLDDAGYDRCECGGLL